MPDFTRGAIVLEGDLPFGADFYYGIELFKVGYDEAMHKNSCRS